MKKASIMSRINTPSIEEATGATAELYRQIKKGLGRVPNAYATIGAHHPAGLKAILQADAVQGTLSKQEKEIIKLTVSTIAGCDYCQAAHYLVGKLTGLEATMLKRVVTEEPTGNSKFDALITFVKALLTTKGTLPEHEIAAIRNAGYSDAQLVDIGLVMAVITFTNVFNRINDTEVDFPVIV